MAGQVDGALWVRSFQPVDRAGVRLVCFPHAGGSASFFHPMARSLHPHIGVLAVQYPGRQDRRSEPGVRDIRELARRIAPELVPWSAAGPLAFFGHSMGAVVAFETARELRRLTGRPPVMLFASGRRAPSTVRDERLHQHGDEAIIGELRLLNGTDAAIFQDEELVRMVLPALRSDYEAIETYSCAPDVTVDCPVLALIGDRDPRVTADEARAWRRHTTGPFDLEVFDGGHFYLVPHAARIIDRIRARLATAAAVPGHRTDRPLPEGGGDRVTTEGRR
ncbi:thioesterase II family protein [Streptomyces sp. NPDC018031]|uniref:thioesterase II family protein n=1 Tax=Streptomyces sp. NPDC018031 TaxID=3365033 RepID=UPI0037B2D1DE